MKLKSITPAVLVSDDLKLVVEKVQDGKHWLVISHLWLCSEPKTRLFGTEQDADDFIEYLREEG